MKNKVLHHSVRESEIMGISIARSARLERFDADQLFHEILENRYDLCKLKLNAADEHIFDKLEELGIPYRIYSLISRNAISADSIKAEQLHQALEFVAYSEQLENTLSALVEECTLHKTAVNYNQGSISEYLSADKIAAASAEYASSIQSDENQNLRSWLIQFEGEFVGFVFGSIEKSILEGLLYGIIPKFRGRGFATEIMRFLKRQVLLENLGGFENDVVLQNIASLKPIIKQGVLPTSSYVHVYIHAFCAFRQGEVLRFHLKEEERTTAQILSRIEEQIGSAATCHVVQMKLLSTYNLSDCILAELSIIQQTEKHIDLRCFLSDETQRIGMISLKFTCI